MCPFIRTKPSSPTAPSDGQVFGVAVQSGVLLVDYQFAALTGPTLTSGTR